MSDSESSTPFEPVDLDEVGPWTELKLEIVRKYTEAYTKVLRAQPWCKGIAYIDGFAGAGKHRLKGSPEQVIDGSPRVVLGLDDAFDAYHFIDLKNQRVEGLRAIGAEFGRGERVLVHSGDCNAILKDKIIPHYGFDQYRRAVCLLDPYNLNPDWDTMTSIAATKAIEIFQNVMIMDANMNVFLKDQSKRTPAQEARMDRFWGDGSWREAGYRESVQMGMFGPPEEEKVSNQAIIEAYCERLRTVAGFDHVVDPLPMKNNQGAVVYYLVFAGPNKIGAKIAREIFKKYR